VVTWLWIQKQLKNHLVDLDFAPWVIGELLFHEAENRGREARYSTVKHEGKPASLATLPPGTAVLPARLAWSRVPC
jgi:hypothetical protein